MSKKVIVCEKPSVARTVAKTLHVSGNHDGYIENEEWIITWCVGHLVAMSYPEKYDEKYKSWVIEDLPFLPDNYKYEVIDNVKDQFAVVKKIYNRSDIDTIYYCPDPAREGIYLQYLVRQEAGIKQGVKELCIWIDSQTEDEIKRGIKEAKPLDTYWPLAKSGYIRAIEDYAIGINISRALTVKHRSCYTIKNPVAVGRVMTCVLGMIVNREREIENFVPETFYKIQSCINVDGADVVATWKINKDDPMYAKFEPKLHGDSGFTDKAFAEGFIKGLGQSVKIDNIEIKEEKKYAPLLFNLAELQATCSKALHISPDKTLEIVQNLYEKKLTTYPRTDSRVLSTAIAMEIGKNIQGLTAVPNLGAYANQIMASGSYKNIANTRYTDDSKVSDHYALIPTGENIGQLLILSEAELAVYQIIVKRFLSIFLPPAVYKKVSITESDTVRNQKFYATGSALIEEGYMKCSGAPSNKETLPPVVETLKNGDVYNAIYSIKESETTPPSRYTSGSIILAMENAGNLIEDEDLRAQIKGTGIGTSATRADVFKKLLAKEFINMNNKTQVLTPAPFGLFVYEIVDNFIPSMLSPKMTAEWEKGLELIANNQLDAEKYKIKMNNFIIDAVENIKNGTISESTKTFASGLPQVERKDQKPAAIKAKDIGTYLNVPFEDKDTVKLMGARWDGNKKAWYVPAGADLTKFGKWMISGKAQTNIKKMYLNVPFDDKDEVKSLGAKWDGDKKQWYILNTQKTNAFNKWL